MRVRGTMTPLAGDGLRLSGRGMTEQALSIHRTQEIPISAGFKTGGQIPCGLPSVIGERREKEPVAPSHHVARAMFAGADPVQNRMTLRERIASDRLLVKLAVALYGAVSGDRRRLPQWRRR